MKNNISTLLFRTFYHRAVSKELKKRGFPQNIKHSIMKEYKEILERAADIGNSKLLSSYVMCMYFIAMNRADGKTAEENYEILKDGLLASGLFHKVMGDADAYLDPKKLPGRLAWSEESHQRKYRNDWVVDILNGNGVYELGYDYTECGVVKLCRDEGCPELARHLCRMDFVLAEMMNMKLERTSTLAEGGERCDFRYSRKR